MRASAAAVVGNPWLGTGPREDLAPVVARWAPVLAKLLTEKLVQALGGTDRIEAFGKAAIVGTGGEIEHGGALIHTPYFGNLVREYLEGESIICFSDTRARAGQSLVVPLWHKTHLATRSHYQTVDVRVPDAPRADEIVVVAAASTGPAPTPASATASPIPLSRPRAWRASRHERPQDRHRRGGDPVGGRPRGVAAGPRRRRRRGDRQSLAGQGFVEDLGPGIEVAALLADRFEVVAPDLTGHGGRSAVPAGTTLADLAHGVAADIPAGSHLVGFSLGALVAQHLAVHRPESAATLTSVSSVCRRTPAERATVLERLRTAESDFRTGVEASVERWFTGTEVTGHWVERIRATLLANDPASFLACYRVFATADAEIGPLLSRVSIPSLTVTVADDPGSTPAMTRRLAAALPDCRAVVVPRTRHMLPVQRPREFADRLTAFIGERAHV